MFDVPRKPRENSEGGRYHVFARGNGKQLVFLSDRDRILYLHLLEQTVATYDWICLAYCLMDNHIHLLVETPKANLSSGMQHFHSSYAQAFNRRHDRCGHVFQGRYGAERICSDRQLCAAAAYIARNPVEAGLCDRPDQWSWSSLHRLRDGAGLSWIANERLLSFFGAEPRSALNSYVELAEQPNVSKPQGV